MPAQRVLLSAAIKTAKKRLRFMPERRQNENLEHAACSLAEAYRIGAEEAQQEILNRLRQLSTAAKESR